MATVEETLLAFKADLSVLEPRQLVQRHITSGDCVAISAAQYGHLRSQVADHFGVHPTVEVLVVGSARLGFSISPSQRWKPFDDDSDIDVAIVSQVLYRRIWGELSEYVLAGGGWDRKHDFLGYSLHGWIRPDLLPASAGLPLGDEWFEYFRSLTRDRICGQYKVSGALYYDIDFLERYQMRAASLCATTEGD